MSTQLPTNLKQIPTSSSALNHQSSSIKSIFNFILNSSLAFKSLCASLIVGYLLTFIDKSLYFLCVIPGKLLPPSFFLWTLVTHSFIENELLQVIINIFVILLYCKMLEPLWGTRECIKFYFLITIIVSIQTTLVLLFLYTITFNEILIFNTFIHGLASFIGGFSVAIKQIMPDTILLNIGIIRIKQDDLPLIFLLISTLFYLIKLIEFIFLIMLFFGFLNSWIYLRFYQVHKNGVKGDSSQSFSFASFFPSIIQPFVAIISNTIFDILVRIRVCEKPPKRYNISSTPQISLNLNNTQTLDTIDAERRRQKALKALKERLDKTEKNELNNLNSQWAISSNNNNNSNNNYDDSLSGDVTGKLLNQEHVIDEQNIYPVNKSSTDTTSVSVNNDNVVLDLNK